MNYVDIIRYVSLSVTVLAMLSAARQDVRSREVSDAHWGIIGFIGIACNLVCAEQGNFSWASVSMAVSSAIMLYVIVYAKQKTGLVLGIFSLALSAYILVTDTADIDVWIYAVSVFMCPVFLMFYWTGIVRGGADVKCLIAIGLAIPAYPDFGLNMFSDVNELVRIVFAPSISLLFLASVFSVFGCSAYCIAKNRGQTVTGRYRGFMMPVCQVDGAFVWPAENIIGGKRVRCGIPDDSDVPDICEKFRTAGIEKIYVTPMVPFILPITAALIFVLSIGNPLFIL